MKCPRCTEPNDTAERFCWKCVMFPDKSLTESKLRREAEEIENSIVDSNVIDGSTRKLVMDFPEECKDAILETVLRQILSSPELVRRFRAVTFLNRSRNASSERNSLSPLFV